MTNRISSVLAWQFRALIVRSVNRQPASEQGLTILECLVAIMLIGLTAALLTPPLLIATASRIQNRRAEQAFQVAQAEVDRINTLVQLGRHRNAILPAVANVAGDNFANVLPPTQIAQLLATPRSSTAPCPDAAYSNQSIPTTTALPVDVDGDCKADFLMQVFRTQGLTTQLERNKPNVNDRRPAQFALGVRVYSVTARENLLSGNLARPIKAASLAISSGQGQQATHPLITIYKPISWGERSSTLCTYLDSTDANSINECANLQP